MTNQEAFDKVARHLLTQKKKSVGVFKPWTGEICMYRSPTGEKCAIGCLIENAEYKQEFEREDVYGLVRRFDPPSLRGVDTDVLKSLQVVHDYSTEESWAEALLEVAEYFNLKVIIPLPEVMS